MVDHQNSRFDSRRLIDNSEVRIFLSSTFSDMQQERTALIKTFDTLKIVANRRNITLSVIDLRWGVTEEESRSGKVLSVCLEEIEHSHPFFIGLLGSRYGTSPARSEIEKNPELKERYPWIQEDIDNEWSITEMEMQYGVLRNDKDVDALFLIKNTPNTLPDDNVRLTSLKNQILDQSRFPTCDYTSIDDLCQKVETAVLAILDKHFPQTENNRLEHERTNQKAFINSRHGHYRKLSADFKRLDDFLNGDEIHLVITGPSGMGKSALIANWLKEKEVTQHSYNIIYHFVGNSFSGSDHRQILQHICDELYNRYSIKRYEGLNETLEDEAQRVLIEAGRKGKPVVLVIDGINQIADHDFSHSKHLETQRDIFIFQCLTGCRVGDLLTLTPDNIINGILVYDPHKTKGTGTQARVPLHDKAKALVQKYEGKDRAGRLFPFISAQKYNDAIKVIFTQAGITRSVVVRNPKTGESETRPINEVASSHLARRTFIGNAYFKVTDPNLIGKMSGHVDGSRAFKRYRKIEDETLKNVIDLIG